MGIGDWGLGVGGWGGVGGGGQDPPQHHNTQTPTHTEFNII